MCSPNYAQRHREWIPVGPAESEVAPRSPFGTDDYLVKPVTRLCSAESKLWVDRSYALTVSLICRIQRNWNSFATRTSSPRCRPMFSKTANSLHSVSFCVPSRKSRPPETKKKYSKHSRLKKHWPVLAAQSQKKLLVDLSPISVVPEIPEFQVKNDHYINCFLLKGSCRLTLKSSPAFLSM